MRIAYLLAGSNPDLQPILDALAATLLPAAAKANHAVFYRNGAAQTADQVFARIAGAFDETVATVTRPAEPGQALPVSAAAAATIAAVVSQATLYHHRDSAQLQSLSMLAMTLLDSLSSPGAATDSDSSNEWIVQESLLPIQCHVC